MVRIDVEEPLQGTQRLARLCRYAGELMQPEHCTTTRTGGTQSVADRFATVVFQQPVRADLETVASNFLHSHFHGLVRAMKADIPSRPVDTDWPGASLS